MIEERYEEVITSTAMRERQEAVDARRFHRDWQHFSVVAAPASGPSQSYWDQPTSSKALGLGSRPRAPEPDPDELQLGIRPRMGRFSSHEPFEKDIVQSEKYERWLKWKATFDVALSIMDGAPTEHQKAGLLYIHVGEEVRDIINMLQLPPMQGTRAVAGSVYAALSGGLNDYFRTLVDQTTDYARYTSRKQLPGESVHTYAVKLRDLALRVVVGHETVAFRHQLLSGLANRALAKKATEEGAVRMTIADIIQQAGRIEQAAGPGPTMPWNQSDGARPMVMNVEEKGGPSGFGRKRRFGGDDRARQVKW